MEELKPASAESPYLIPAAIVAAGLIIGAAVYFQSPNKSGLNLNKDKEIKTVTLDVDDHYILGNPAAEVAIIEFSDFQCPFCKRFFDQTFSSIKEKYVKTGKVKFIYRDFPLSSIHENAQKSAEAALCAGDQDKFWQMHDKIFENQDDLSVENLKKLAGSLGLVSDFDSCLDSNKYEAKVKKDFDLGVSLGVGGTPTFFIGRLPIQVKYQDSLNSGVLDREKYKVLVGALPFSEFEKAIEEALNK